ncbi:MAG: hypothetical protein KGR17_07100 [Acidobacteria bacterium]|nr:hypothetical protein [Acidobacteriota bacterium]
MSVVGGAGGFTGGTVVDGGNVVDVVVDVVVEVVVVATGVVVVGASVVVGCVGDVGGTGAAGGGSVLAALRVGVPFGRQALAATARPPINIPRTAARRPADPGVPSAPTVAAS